MHPLRTFHFIPLHPPADRSEGEVINAEVEPGLIVRSDNEWDVLDEVIVGVAERSAFPTERRATIEATMPRAHWDRFDGSPFPEAIVEGAAAELDTLAATLGDEGIMVRRPEVVDWSSIGGHTGAMARDSLLVVGDRLIEAPMPWRSRQHELAAFRPLLEQYEAAGATWVRAPRVADPDSLLTKERRAAPATNNDPWVINNTAPAFDAADFMRFDQHIIGQFSNVTNPAGVAWLREVLGAEYHVHVLAFDDPHAMHIDASITPLREGLMMFNPSRVDPSTLTASVFPDWELIPTPQPRERSWPPLYMTSAWVNMNILALGDDRVVIEEHDENVAELLEDHGLKVLAIPFRHVQAIGGSIHCATLDIRRYAKHTAEDPFRQSR